MKLHPAGCPVDLGDAHLGGQSLQEPAQGEPQEHGTQIEGPRSPSIEEWPLEGKEGPWGLGNGRDALEAEAQRGDEKDRERAGGANRMSAQVEEMEEEGSLCRPSRAHRSPEAFQEVTRQAFKMAINP